MGERILDLGANFSVKGPKLEAGKTFWRNTQLFPRKLNFASWQLFVTSRSLSHRWLRPHKWGKFGVPRLLNSKPGFPHSRSNSHMYELVAVISGPEFLKQHKEWNLKSHTIPYPEKYAFWATWEMAPTNTDYWVDNYLKHALIWSCDKAASLLNADASLVELVSHIPGARQFLNADWLWNLYPDDCKLTVVLTMYLAQFSTLHTQGLLCPWWIISIRASINSDLDRSWSIVVFKRSGTAQPPLKRPIRKYRANLNAHEATSNPQSHLK